jgi:hypothetical protein
MCDPPSTKACAPVDGIAADEPAPLEHAERVRPKASAAPAQRRLKRTLELLPIASSEEKLVLREYVHA